MRMSRQELSELQRKYSELNISCHKKASGMYWLGRFSPRVAALYQTLKTKDADYIRDVNRVVAGFDKMESREVISEAAERERENDVK